MKLENEIYSEIASKGADFTLFVDISDLPQEITKGYPNAILIGMKLSREYLRKVRITEEYVKQIVRNNKVEEDEFYRKEISVDRIADEISIYIRSRGYCAYSQSEKSNLSSGHYNSELKSTPLPHKAIALRAGIGWIGKNNLLVSRDFGCAVCICTLLTDAPLETELHKPEDSECGNCIKCQEVCPEGAIKGNSWSPGISRDELVDVSKCTTCLKCLAFCMWTEKYIG